MATVASLIAQLSEIEDKEQPIAFQYYLWDDFTYLYEDADGDVDTKAVFAEAVDVCDDYLWSNTWDCLAGEIQDEIERVSPKEEETN